MLTKHAFSILFALFAMIFGNAFVFASPANNFDKPVMHPLIPLIDEDGAHVLNSGKPYSTKMSCGNGSGGGCHDYDKMNHAYHFEQGRDEADDLFGVRRGINHMVSPGYFGGYNCVQGNQTGALAKKVNTNPLDFAEWGAAGFLKACSSCHMGGGWEETDRDGIRYDQRAVDSIPFGDGDYYERDKASPTGLSLFDWKKSGVREADCLSCHADFTGLEIKGTEVNKTGASTAYQHWGFLQDQKFIRNNFFRYANSAMFEFLNLRPNDPAYPNGLNLLSVKRKNFKTGTTYKPDYDLDVDANGNPQLVWNPAAFDSTGKVQIPMLRFPANDNCMMCHYASGGINRISSGKANGSRRGFQGFGDESLPTLDSNGIVKPDFKDDVHKGKSWTDDTGQTRIMDNCNACHAKQYYKASYENIDLDADHNFPKGDGDNDVRRDLDFFPGPLSCEYCHDTAKAPALPSGQKNALDAHRELWKSRGDMRGYTADTLNKITQTHLDVVACQTCHIPSVAQSATTPIQIRYRYRKAEDGKMKIIPYKPHTRYYAQDKVSGRVLSRYETNTAAPLATYDDWKALKISYDELLKTKGYSNPNVRFVQNESNEYIITHQTKTSPEALQCISCHSRKQDGSFSSLISKTGLFGEGNVAKVQQLPDRRLVDEGIVELGQPYFKVDNTGLITENVADVLSATLTDPAMSLFRASSAKDYAGEWKLLDANSAFSRLGIFNALQQQTLSAKLGSNQVFLFDVLHGAQSLKSMGVLAASGSLMDKLYPSQRLAVQVRDVSAQEMSAFSKSKLGNAASGIYRLSITNSLNAENIDNFLGNKVLLKLPYHGSETELGKIKILKLVNNVWVRADVEPVLLQPVSKDVGTDLPSNNSVSNLNEGFMVIAINEPFDSLMLADESKIPDTTGITLAKAKQQWKKAGNTLSQAKRNLATAEQKAAQAKKASVTATAKAEAKAAKVLPLKGVARVRAQKAADIAANAAQKAAQKATNLTNAATTAKNALSAASEAYLYAADIYNRVLTGG